MNNKFTKIFSTISVENNIYVKVLELGYKNHSIGISFDEVINELNIDLSNELFEINFAHWFYSNFYNENFEYSILAQKNSTFDVHHFNKHNYKNSKKHNKEKSFIKGDSLNKYIDYLELQRTRKSSRNATVISMLSMLIAVASIIIPRIYPKNKEPFYNVEITDKWNKCCKHKSDYPSYCKPRTKQMNNTKANTSTNLDSISQLKSN